MSLPFKIKKMAIPDVDSSFLVDEVVSSIAKIKKQKQRPNTERIFSMMVKSHPELTLACLNEAIDRAIREGLVVNYLHNGVYSYRVVPTTSSESFSKFVSDRNVEDTVKCLFYDTKPKEYTIETLESSVKQRFPSGSLFSSCSRDVITNVCTELVQLGELTYAKGVYMRNKSVQRDVGNVKQFSMLNNNNNTKSSSLTTLSSQRTDLNTFSKCEPPDICNTKQTLSTSNCDSMIDQTTNDSTATRKDGSTLDDTRCSSKGSFLNLQSPSSDASSDKPKKKKARSLQVSFLFDSLSSFFSVSGETRRTSRPIIDKTTITNSHVAMGNKHPATEAEKSSIRSNPKKKTVKGKSKSVSKKTFPQSTPKNLSLWETESSLSSKEKSKFETLSQVVVKSPVKSTMKVLMTSFDKNSSFHSQDLSKVIKSNLEECDLNEINLASITEEDQTSFVESKPSASTMSTASQSVDIAFGRFLLTSPNVTLLVKEDLRQKKLVMCEFCLGILDSSRCLERHLLKCGLHCPPGSELYRFNDVKLFHITSSNQPLYCKRLGRLVPLLTVIEQTVNNNDSNCIPAMEKVLPTELSATPTFEELNYFLLTIQDRSGSHLAGILSYDDHEDGHWTVTYLFVLPQYRNQGHAKCLVNLVYHMASMQGGKVVVKLNIPLKNHVLNLFQSVWRGIILDYLINIETHKLHFQLEEISRATSIELKDVSSSLKSLKLESDFYLTDQAVDMTQSQKEEMKRGSESHLLLSGLTLPFNVKYCGSTQELERLHFASDSLFPDAGYSSILTYKSRRGPSTGRSDAEKNSLERLWNLLTGIGIEIDPQMLDKFGEEDRDVSRKRKNEEDDYSDSGSFTKRFQCLDDLESQSTYKESFATHMEQGEVHSNSNNSNIKEFSPSTQIESNDNQDCKSFDPSVNNNMETNATLDKGSNHFQPAATLETKQSEEQMEENNSSNRSDGDMPSLEDLAATPSAGTSSVGVTMSSPSPPDLKRENMNIASNRDEVTVVSSVRSDHSEVDVGGPTFSPLKGQSSLPSSVKNVTSHCSTDDDHMINSVKNVHEDDDCTVVAVEKASNNACWNAPEKSTSSCADSVGGFIPHTRNYHHHHHHQTDASENMERKVMQPLQHREGFHMNVSPYEDTTKQQHLQHASYTTSHQEEAAYSRQCQSVAPVNSGNTKGGKSKKSSKAANDTGFCVASAERMNEKTLSGLNQMQERCSSVFVDPSHYPPLSFNQGITNNQLCQRPMDYMDSRVDRPATRCGFESSFPQNFNPEFSSRFVNPHLPSSSLDANINYQIQDRNLPPNCMPVSQGKMGHPAGYNGSRSQQSSLSKTSKRTNKSHGAAPAVCYAGTKTSNVPPHSPTLGSAISMPSDPLLNAICRLPNMTQGFEISSPSYGLPNRFNSEPAKSNFVSSNTNSNRISYFNQQPSPPGACQIQTQHNANQSLPPHINRGNNGGNGSSSSESSLSLHHRPTDDASHQQALFLQHQRQQQAAYLNPAAYFAKLHQFHSEFGHQFQYPAPFHSSASPSPIDMSLHVPTRPSVVDGKAPSLLGMQQHRDSFSEVDFFPSYKVFNFGPYASSVDPRNIVHRNPQNQVGMFGHQQQPPLDPGIQSSYSAYLNGGNRVGNDLFPNSNINDLMRK